jgi:hypothetical protein
MRSMYVVCELKTLSKMANGTQSILHLMQHGVNDVFYIIEGVRSPMRSQPQ